MVVVVTTQGGISASGHDLEHALREAQDRDVKSAAAQIVDGVDAFAGVVQPVGDCRGCRFVDQAQHIDAGQLGRILGGLALGIVKVGRHGNDGAIQVIVESVFGAIAQCGQYFGADLDG